MTFLDCLEKKAKLSKKQKEDLAAEYDQRYNIIIAERAKDDAGAVQAAQEAASAVFNSLETKMLQKKNNILRHQKAVENSWSFISNRVSKKQEAWDSALKDRPILKKVVDSKYAGWLFYKPDFDNEIENFLVMIDRHQKGLEREMQYEIREAIQYFLPNAFGVTTAQTKQNIEMIWRAAGGEDVGNKELNAAGAKVRETFDLLTDMYIKEGGVMGKLENWMPQHHDAAAIRTAGVDQWSNDIIPLIDWEKTRDAQGFKIPEAYRKEFLGYIWETLSTGGANKSARAGFEGASIFSRGKSLAGKRSESRIIHFKSPTEQVKYNNAYGVDNLAYSIMNHITSMTRDIAILKQMGPNPDLVVTNWDLRLSNSEKLSEFNKKMFDVLAGRTAMTGAESNAYKMLTGTQGIMRAAHLGSASIAALGDAYWVAVTARMSGVNELNEFNKGMKNYLKVWRMGKKGPKDIDPNEKTKEAKMLAYSLDAAMGNLLRNFSDDTSYVAKGRSKTDKFVAFGSGASTAVMRMSGLSRLTEHGKEAISYAAFGKTALQKQKGWAELDKDFKSFLVDNTGMTEADWKHIQKAKPTKLKNDEVEFLFPSDIEDMEARVKYSAYIETLRELATNEPGLKTKTVTTGGKRTVDPDRAARNMLFMYRAFPISLLNNFIRGTATRMATHGTRGEPIAIMIGAMASGYMAMSLKDAARNKTPRDLTEWSTWKQAALQSGALSIFDFVLQDQSRYGGSLAQTFMGPMGTFAEDTYKVGGAILTGWDDDKHGWLEEVQKTGTNWVKRNFPGQSLWYWRMALEHDTLEGLSRIGYTSDEYYRKKAQERKIMAQQGQEYLIK